MKEESILKQQQRSNTADIVSTLTITVMMILIGLLLSAAAAKVYKNIVVSSAENFELRTSLSYVASKVRAADRVSVISGAGHGSILKLTEELDGEQFATYVFHRDGYLYEIMQEASEEPDLEGAVSVMEIADMQISSSGNLVTLRAANNEGKSEELSIVLRAGSVTEDMR